MVVGGRVPVLAAAVAVLAVLTTSASAPTVPRQPGGLIDACRDASYTDKDEEQAGTWEWWLGDGARPMGLDTEQTAALLQEAVEVITTSYNDCGLADEVSARARYRGVTSLESDIPNEDGWTSCGDGSWDGRDGRSVIDFGDLDAMVRDGRTVVPIALECTWVVPMPFADNNIIESDIRINTVDYDFFLTPSPLCRDRFDLYGVVVHEVAHAFGMGDVEGVRHAPLTMSLVALDCTTDARTLGRGDVLGLRNTY